MYWRVVSLWLFSCRLSMLPVLCCAVLCCAVLCCASATCAVLCCAVLCYLCCAASCCWCRQHMEWQLQGQVVDAAICFPPPHPPPSPPTTHQIMLPPPTLPVLHPSPACVAYTLQGESARRAITGAEFFNRFPSLHTFLLTQLQAATQQLQQGGAVVHPSLFPVLALLSRLR